MKRIPTLLYTLLLCSLSVSAQDFCGTEMPDDYAEHLRTKDRSYQINHHQRGSTIYIPIQYHVIGTDEGLGFFPFDFVADLHCTLNSIFGDADIEFYLYDNLNYIKNSNFYSYSSYNEGNQMMITHNVQGVCNIYIVDDPVGVCGYAFFPNSGPNGGGIALSQDCSYPNSTTLPHEMGHYLGLPHTFSTSNGIEFVNGNNCANSGDMFCDTPADFLNYRWNCPYIGNATDPNGDLYSTVIDESLYMSYSLDNCQNRFSNQQKIEMYNVAQSERPYLFNHDVPASVLLDSVNLKTPINNSQAVPKNYAALKWDAVADAEYYHINVINVFNPNLYNLDTILEVTHIILKDLNDGDTYSWSVKAYSRSNFCALRSSSQFFTPNSYTIDAAKTNPLCYQEDNGQIQLTINGGTFPYTYVWSNGATTSSIGDLTDGEYEVTITDQLNNTAITTVFLTEPDELVISINSNGSNSVSVNAVGGTQPYIYAWSTGDFGQTINTELRGEITVVVTDAHNCQKVETIEFDDVSGIHEVTSIQNLSIFPNPLRSANELVIEFESKDQHDGEIFVFSSNGMKQFSIDVNVKQGKNSYTLPTNELSSGMYLIQFRSDQFFSTNRFTVID